MKQRPRRYITDSEMAVIWDRWEKGDSINAIARDLGRYHSAVQGAMARTGGIRPAPRRRSRLALTLAEREEISRGIVVGHSIRAIASQLGRAPSTSDIGIQTFFGPLVIRARQSLGQNYPRLHIGFRGLSAALQFCQ